MKNSNFSPLTRVVMLAAVYFIAAVPEAQFGMTGHTALVWPPAGIALAAISLLGYRYWPGVACGAALFAFMRGFPPGYFMLGLILGNTVGAILCVYLLERFVKFQTGLERVRDVAGFVGLACLLGTTINAAFNVVGLCYSGAVHWDQMLSTLADWWVPNAMAGLVVAPVIMTWASPTFVRWSAKLTIEAVICTIGLAVATSISCSWYAFGIQNYPLAYLPYPFLVWGALRFGQRGATMGTLVVATLSIYALLEGHGPFFAGANREKESLMLIGSYIGILAITNMLLAAAAMERRVAEEVARKSEAMFLLISENVGDLIAVTDASGKRLYNSPYYSKLFGMAGNLAGTNAFDQLHPDDRERVKNVFQETIRTGIGQRIEYRFLLPDGSVRYIESLGNYVRGDRGQLDKVVSIARDITDRKKGEEELQKSEELWRTMFAAANDAILLLDDQYRVLMCNETASRMYGYAQRELIGMNIKDLRAQDLRDELSSQMTDILRSEGLRWESRHVRQDGTSFPVEISSKPLTAAGQQQFVQIIRDISDSKQHAEELAKARDAALAAARQKSEFLANMSHEIRTPMNGIIGMSNLLLNTPLDSHQQDYATTIKTSANVLLTIINDILDFSKIEAGKMTLEKVNFDLRETVEDAVELLADRAHEKRIELVSFIQPDISTELCGDPTRIRQILTNLIGNAVKFTDNGEVVVKVVKYGETATHLSLRFSISDTGIGIPLEIQSRLFQSFSQADGSTTRKYGGTGLGLAICKQLANLMGGEIGLESAAGKGSTFWFVIPLQKQLPTETRSPALRRSLNDIRILIVDDSATSREILHHQFQAWRMHDLSASSGEQALVMLREASASKKPIELAVLDMMMPGMDGLTLARLIKSDPALAETKLLMLTSGERIELKALREAGVEDFLLKPVKQSRLFNSICTVLAETSTEPVAARTAASPIPKTSVAPIRILLAEDNIINQKVALGQLKEIGYTADIAVNGKEVLANLDRASYDVILMDCQMPEMDGYEATAQIRNREQNQSSDRRTHIIAMTANAMQGDRERCLAAQMDDYVSKPVDVEALKAALDRWLARGTISLGVANSTSVSEIKTKASVVTSPAPEITPPVDLRRLNRVTGNDPEKLKEMIEMYLTQAETILKGLQVAIQSSSATDVTGLAHKLCGASSTCGIAALVPILRELEQIGRDDQLAGAAQLLADANVQFDRVRQFLNTQVEAA